MAEKRHVATGEARSTAEIREVIVRGLAPYLGETMARSAVQAHSQKLGIGDSGPNPEQLEALLGKIGSGLNIFVGREKSAGIVAEIRGALAREAVR